MKDPALLSPEARRFSSYPGGHQEGYADTFKNLFRDFYGNLGTEDSGSNRPDFPGFEDGHRELLLMEAIERSAREERWISLAGPTPENSICS